MIVYICSGNEDATPNALARWLNLRNDPLRITFAATTAGAIAIEYELATTGYPRPMHRVTRGEPVELERLP